MLPPPLLLLNLWPIMFYLRQEFIFPRLCRCYFVCCSRHVFTHFEGDFLFGYSLSLSRSFCSINSIYSFFIVCINVCRAYELFFTAYQLHFYQNDDFICVRYTLCTLHTFLHWPKCERKKTFCKAEEKEPSQNSKLGHYLIRAWTDCFRKKTSKK